MPGQDLSLKDEPLPLTGESKRKTYIEGHLEPVVGLSSSPQFNSTYMVANAILFLVFQAGFFCSIPGYRP